MLSFKTIKNKEVMSYQDEYVFDEMIGRWVTVKEYEEFVQTLMEEQEQDLNENQILGQSTII
jgi:hypothetical protein